jgi:1-phosphofructokinase family hexose kinase
MILTINANAGLDIVMFIDRFISGGTMRPTRVVPSVGGKGLDTAVVLRALGAPVQAVSFVAGRNGEILAELVQERGIPTDWIWLEGETRIANVIVETELRRHSHITTPGYTVTLADCRVFKERILQHAAQASWAVMSGTLPGGAPASLYGEITGLLHQAGVRVLIDCFGPPARAALEAVPDIVKMNQAEFRKTFDTQPTGWDEWVRAVREVMDCHHLQNFILTCGEEGLLAFTPQAVYQATTPRMEEVNAAGSGDAVSGTVAYRLSLGDDWEQTLYWAAAAGAAVVLTEGTAECRLEDVLSILPHTSVNELRHE